MIDEFINQEKSKDYYIKMMEKLDEEYANYTIFPSRKDLFRTFELCDDPKVVILGQDPYIHLGEAHGIAFSVYDAKIPPSLRNIFKELTDDLGIERVSGDLSDWCRSGVLMFNTIFTVRENASLSHKDIGWETFSENLIGYLDDKYPDLVFILWGSYARRFKKFIKNGSIIEGVHPSPLSSYRGFFGSKPFSKCNAILANKGISGIDWR